MAASTASPASATAALAPPLTAPEPELSDAALLRARVRYDDSALKAPRWETLHPQPTTCCIAYDPGGRFLAAGTTLGEVRV